MSHRICLASHQNLFRTLLRDHLVQHTGAEVVVEFTTAAPFLEKTTDLRGIDLFIVDADMAAASPLSAIRALRARNRAAKIVLITDVPGAYLADWVVRFGLSGLLHKRDTLEQFLGAVNMIMGGVFVVSAHVDLAGRGNFKSVLSDREIEVLALIGQGYRFDQIARRLRITKGTVVTHKRNIMGKLRVHSYRGLILYALSSGLVSADRARLTQP